MRKARRSRETGQGLLGRAVPWLVLGGLVCLVSAKNAGAFNIDLGVPDLKVRWDTTIKYSAAWRMEDQDSKILGNSGGPNSDDGDRAFERGLISNRLDVLSEFDAIYKDFGFRASGAGWYDTMYFNARNRNDSPATFNAISVDHDEFTKDTQDLHGRKVELLDAFLFGKQDLWDNGVLSMRLGRYTLLYGESLFFGGNGVSAAQAPIDVVKAVSVPNSQFKEIGMPVPQVSAQLQILQGLTVGGYYQFKWIKNRVPAAGSYFSFSDAFDDGGERFVVGPPLMPGGLPIAFYRGSDIDATAPQFGAQVKFKPNGGSFDYGLYAARFNSKDFIMYLRPGVGAGPQTPFTGQIGDYVAVYPEKIWVFGASAATVVGDANVSGEVSYRRNTPLAVASVEPLLRDAHGVPILDPFGNDIGDTRADGDKNAAYPVGDTLHAQVSMIEVINETPLWGGANLLGEIAYNHRVKVSKNEDQLDRSCEKDAAAIRIVFEPQYFQVFPQVDLTIPIGFSYTWGRSSLSSTVFGPDQGGDINVGLNFDLWKTWKTGLQFTHYYGPRGPYATAKGLTYKQFWGDRDFLSLSVQRSF